jgi:MFS family permease
VRTAARTAQRSGGLSAAGGTALVFAASGAIQATWLSRLPALNERLGLQLLGVSAALIAVSLGWLVSMPVASWVCRRVGPAPVVWFSLAGACAALVGIAGPTSLATLLPVLVLFGLTTGAWDLAMNVHASHVERGDPPRHWMPLVHGFWSVGAALGAGVGAVAAYAHVPLLVQFTTVSVLFGLACVVGVTAFADRGDMRSGDQGTQRPLTAIAVFALCGAILEGSGADWLTIFFTEERDSSPARAAAAYAVFACAMAGGRFLVARLHEPFGRAAMVRWGALVAGIGVLVVTAVPSPAAGYVGAALWGFGVCAAFPAALSASAEPGPRPGPRRPRERAIAVVATVGYSGSLVGPVVIGALAIRFGLASAFSALLVLAVAAAALAGKVAAVRSPAA